MRLEILIPGEDLMFYNLSSPSMTLGSSDGCDIVVPHPEVSRHHLTISSRNDTFFICDQGSTNGTYLNELKLTPGKKAEFNSFFPVRLGAEVLVSLLSDQEDESISQISNNIAEVKSKSHEETKVISLKSLKTSSTKSLVKKRNEIKTKKSEDKSSKIKKTKKRKFKLIHLIAISIISAGAYMQYLSIEESKLKSLSLANAVTVESKPIPEEKYVNLSKNQISELQAFFEMNIQGKKCTDEITLKICNQLQLKNLWGAILKNKTIYLFYDASKIINEAESILYKISSSNNITTAEISELTSAFFIGDTLMQNIDPSELKDYQIRIGLFTNYSTPELKTVISLDVSLLPNLSILLNKKRLKAIESQGLQVIDFTKKYYTSASIR